MGLTTTSRPLDSWTHGSWLFEKLFHISTLLPMHLQCLLNSRAGPIMLPVLVPTRLPKDGATPWRSPLLTQGNNLIGKIHEGLSGVYASIKRKEVSE